MEQPIFIYSDYCNYCMKFLEMLIKHPDLYNSVTLLNIDIDQVSKQRPKLFYDIQYQLGHSITEVPTIIEKNGEYVLGGEEAFKWLEYEISQTADDSLEGFNPIEMTSFSDAYAPLNSDAFSAREQSFSFVNRPNMKINTPQESSSVSPDDYKRKQQEREQFTNTMQQGQQPQRQQLQQFQGPQIPQRPQFQQGPQFQQHANNVSVKQQEIDARLRQLELEREQVSIPNGQQHHVDFRTGYVG